MKDTCPLGAMSVAVQASPSGSLTQRTMTAKERNQLQCLLEEFDVETSSRVERMKLHVKQMTLAARTVYKTALIKMPKARREMTIAQLLGGVDPLKRSPTITRTVKKRQKREFVASGVDRAPQQGRRMTRSMATASKECTNRTATRMDAFHPGAMKTPARPAHQLDPAATPLVTPRFDPRLPQTPAVWAKDARAYRQGETIVPLSGISMNGSPITIRDDESSRVINSIFASDRLRTTMAIGGVPPSSSTTGARQRDTLQITVPDNGMESPIIDVEKLSRQERSEVIERLAVMQRHMASMMNQLKPE